MARLVGGRFVWPGLCCALVAVPFLSVQFAPLADLPQQVAQIRLLLDAADNPGSPYASHVIAPNLLSYAVLGLCWAVLDPLIVGRVAMLLIGILWVVSLHFLAKRRGRPLAAAVLVTVLFFSHTVYWGFFNFAMGMPAFVLWFLLVSKPPTGFRWRDGVLLLFAALGLYLAHALWFAAGLVWFCLHHLIRRVPIRVSLLRGMSVAPVVIVAALWYPRLLASGFRSPTVWLTTPWQRLSPAWIVNASFGGLQGWLEPLCALALVAWLATAAWQNRKDFLSRADRDLLLVGVLFTVAAFLLPHKHTNTILFEKRWLPVGLTFLVLAFPAPVFRDIRMERAAVWLVLIFCAVTTVTWRHVNKTEFSGLGRALDDLPAHERVLGLDFIKSSSMLKIHRPFLQVFAYAQVAKGGTLNFSFADFGSSMVVYEPPRPKPWTRGLEWFPERVRVSDLAHFTYVLVGGREWVHRGLAASFGAQHLTPVTNEGVWRLYRVRSPAPR